MPATITKLTSYGEKVQSPNYSMVFKVVADADYQTGGYAIDLSDSLQATVLAGILAGTNEVLVFPNVGGYTAYYDVATLKLVVYTVAGTEAPLHTDLTGVEWRLVVQY